MESSLNDYEAQRKHKMKIIGSIALALFFVLLALLYINGKYLLYPTVSLDTAIN